VNGGASKILGFSLDCYELCSVPVDRNIRRREMSMVADKMEGKTSAKGGSHQAIARQQYCWVEVLPILHSALPVT